MNQGLRIEIIVKMQKKVGCQGQGGCEPRIEVIVKMQKSRGRGSGLEGGGGLDVKQGLRIEIIVKMQKKKKKSGNRRGHIRVRVNVNQELKLF